MQTELNFTGSKSSESRILKNLDKNVKNKPIIDASCSICTLAAPVSWFGKFSVSVSIIQWGGFLIDTPRVKVYLQRQTQFNSINIYKVTQVLIS